MEDVRNYRGVFILCVACKVYMAVLDERIKNDVTEKEILPDTQARFRKNRNYIDSVFISFNT